MLMEKFRISVIYVCHLFRRKQTVSQRTKDLAQRVDFSEAVDDEGSEPAAKKAAQRWPWEFTHSKLK